MRWTVLLLGSPNEETILYLKKYNIPYIISIEEISPFEAHHTFPGYEYILCWNRNVYPCNALGHIAEYLDFKKINVAWDSEGRNYPHKTRNHWRNHWSLDFIGLPCSAKITNYEMLEVQDLHILPKTCNVSEGYVEYSKALLVNKRKRQDRFSFVKVFDPATGKYS